MLDTGTGLGDASIAPFRRYRDWLVLMAFALALHAPALLAQPRFASAIDVAFVAQDVGVDRVEYLFKVQCIVFAGRTHLDSAYPLVRFVGVGRDLVAKVGLAVLLGSARIDDFLTPLGRHAPI